MSITSTKQSTPICCILRKIEKQPLANQHKDGEKITTLES